MRHVVRLVPNVVEDASRHDPWVGTPLKITGEHPERDLLVLVRNATPTEMPVTNLLSFDSPNQLPGALGDIGNSCGCGPGRFSSCGMHTGCQCLLKDEVGCMVFMQPAQQTSSQHKHSFSSTSLHLTSHSKLHFLASPSSFYFDHSILHVSIHTPLDYHECVSPTFT